MGGSYNIYVGAYLVVKAKEITTYQKLIQCKNHPKETFKKEGFCPECGNPLEVINTSEQEFAGMYEVLDGTEFEDDFYVAEYMFGDKDNNEHAILLSEKQECNIETDIEYGGFEEIPNDSPQKYIDKFKAFNKKALGFLKDKTESMEIKFGVVNYYM